VCVCVCVCHTHHAEPVPGVDPSIARRSGQVFTHTPPSCNTHTVCTMTYLTVYYIRFYLAIASRPLYVPHGTGAYAALTDALHCDTHTQPCLLRLASASLAFFDALKHKPYFWLSVVTILQTLWGNLQGLYMHLLPSMSFP
jgi:hypothetical protein